MSGQIQNVAIADVYRLLHARAEGLSESEVAERRREVGPNRLDADRPLWWAPGLVHQFTNFFTLLLILSAGLCFAADRVQPDQGMGMLGWALLGVAIANALFSFAQQFRAERTMRVLRRMLPRRVRVRRAGRETEVDADDLVPGDVLLLGEGDAAPADARVIATDGMSVSHAALTGESRPIRLRADPSDASTLEADNIVFAGASVLGGAAEAVVFATGFRTEFGRIASLSHRIERGTAPLERQTNHMVRVLTVIAVTMGLAFFAYGVATDRSLWINLVFMMGVIVANVPEGLLPTYTLSLAIGAMRLARRNVLVKGLSAVEALGAVDVICTDKTGTLTQNRLAVAQIADPLDGSDLANGEARRRAIELALAASDLKRTDDGLTGNPLDTAIAEALGDDASVAAIMDGLVRRFPFDPDRRRSAGVWRHDEQAVFAVKGAWESIRPMIAASAETLAAVDATIQRLARHGERVIAVASRLLDAVPPEDVEQTTLECDLTLTALLTLEDPIRPEVPSAVAAARQAGIRIIMVTGDHPDTAIAIARRVGIVPAEGHADVVRGDELAAMRERDLIARIESGVCVFARTTPRQKLKLVNALHELDLVVAMTGDGVNDAPALKAADVGVAMGRSGTDVARESAQIVLLDDNFASIVAGVEQGRTVFENIRKFTNYVLVSNVPEIVPYLLYIVLPVPLALTVIQILAIDLGTDIVPSIGLGQEPPPPDVMRRPPRRRDRGLLTPDLLLHSYAFLGLIEAAWSMALFFLVLDAGGWSWGQELAASDPLYRSATGLTLSSIMLMQIGNLIGRRSASTSGLDLGLIRNPFIVAGIVMEIAASWAILYAPPVAKVLGTGPVAGSWYALAWLGIPLVFGLDYARKRLIGESPSADSGPSPISA